MFLCGSNFCGSSLACAVTPTGIEDIDYLSLTNGLYDDLFLSGNTDFELTHLCPDSWDFDTKLYAKFNENTNAGNVDWNLETVSHIILKSRQEGSFVWQTLAVKEIHVPEDFIINHNDYFIPSKATYEYAIVPVLYGSEGNYALSSITPVFEQIFIIEQDKVFSTDITDGFCDTTRNIPSATIELLNSRYPVFVRNSIANYDTGGCTGAFIPLSEDECDYELSPEQDFNRISYQREVMDMLSDGMPKILKLPDGRIWLVQVTPNPTDTAEQVYQNRKISFQWVEVGDTRSEEDLYYLGFSPVTQEWWNR